MIDEILADPDNDAPRAVYADRLIEQGDPWGEFIQLQLELSRRGDRVRERIEPRINELFNANYLQHQPNDLFAHWIWRRGFIDHVSTTMIEFPYNAPRIFEVAPLLRTLEINVGDIVFGPPADDAARDRAIAARFATFLDLPQVARMEGLCISAKLTFEDASNSDVVDDFGHVVPMMTTRDLGDLAVETLVGRELPKLHMLAISRLTDAGVAMLAASPLARKLDRLVVPWMTGQQLRRYLDHPNTRPLRGLVCEGLIAHDKLAKLDEVSFASGREIKAKRTARSTTQTAQPLHHDDWVFRPVWPNNT